jgi:hypothetical protein
LTSRRKALSKVSASGKVPPEYEKLKIFEIIREVESQLNRLSEGRIDALHESRTAVPTTGTWARGDRIVNKEPSELGSAGSMYTIDGWTCTVGGTPGTWVERRSLTGN